MASSSSSSRYYRRGYTKEEIARMTHCTCKFPIYEQVAWTPENPGRRFKGCPTRNKDKKCDVYGFLDDELPSQYYKDLMYKLYKDNQILECNLDSLTHQDDGQKLIANKETDGQNLIANKATDEVSMELIYKELNELKVKGKVYDMFLLGSTCFMILLVLIAAVILVSIRK